MPDALLQEERIALRPLDELLLERVERRVAAQQRIQQRLGEPGGQRLQRDLGVVALVGPVVLELRPRADHAEDPRGGQALDHPVQQGLRLRIDPVQVLQHEAEGLDLALPQEEALQELQRAPSPLGRIERVPGGVGDRRVQEREHHPDLRGQRIVERAEPGADLVEHLALVVAFLDLEVVAQQRDDREVRRRPAVGHGARLDDPPRGRQLAVDELVDEARLADPGLADDADDLPVTGAGALHRAVEHAELGLAPDEAREPADRGGLEPGARLAGPDQLEGLERVGEALDQQGPRRLHGDVALHELQRLAGEQGAARLRELLHARGEVRGLPDRGVVHVQIAADGAYHDLARVDPDPYAHRHRQARDPGHVAPDRVLHPQRRVAGAKRVILVRQRRAEEGHDPVAQDLVDGALVVVDRLHQGFEDRVEDLPRFLRIPVGQELERALQIGEEHGDLLALAPERLAHAQHAIRQVPRRVGVRGGEAGAFGRTRPGGLRALRTEARGRRQRAGAPAARGRQRRAAIRAELRVGLVIRVTLETLHLVGPRPGAPGTRAP